MSSIISENAISKFESVRKGILWTAIWTLVGGVVLGVVSILSGLNEDPTVGRIMGTVFIFGLMLLICVNNFKRIAFRDVVVQILALLGLVTNLIWAVLWIVLIWMPELGFVSNHISFLLKSAVSASYLSALGFLGSNVMSIFEGEKKGMIKPLKITSLFCLLYECLFFTVLIFIDSSNWYGEFMSRLWMLAGFVGFAWVVLVIVALAISGSERKRLAVTNDKKTSSKSEEALRKEIEEKVRREMIEKEIREQYLKEQGQNDSKQ